MRSKWPPAMPSRGFEPGSVYFDKKSNGKGQIQTNALPTELCSQVTENGNISFIELWQTAN